MEFTRRLVVKCIILAFVFIGVFFCSKFPSISDSLYWHSQVFRNNSCDYSKIRNFNTGFDIGEVKSLVPAGSTILLIDDSIFSFPATRYQLYPLIVRYYDSSYASNNKNAYLIDYNRTLYKDYSFRTLGTDRRIIDIGNSGFSKNISIPSPAYLKILSFIFITAIYILIGCAFISFLKFAPSGRFHLLFTGYVAGLLLTNIILGLEIIAGLSFNQPMVLISCCALCLLTLGINRFNLKKIFRVPEPTKNENESTYKAYKVLLGATVLFAFAVMCLNFMRPVDIGDALSFWMIKSKMIFHQQAFAFPGVLHNGHPILLPLSVATNYAVLNGVADEFAMWGVNLIYLCLLGQIYAGTLALTKQKIVALFAVFLYVLFYYFAYITLTPTGDQLLMVFLTAATINALLYITSRENSHLALSFFFAMGMVLTKHEGFIFAGILGSLLLFFTFSFSKIKDAKPWLIFIGFASLALLPYLWKEYMTVKGYFHGYDAFSSEPVSLHKIYKLVKVHVYMLNASFFQTGIVLGIIFAFAIQYKKYYLPEVQFLLVMIFLCALYSFFGILPWSLSDILTYAWTASPRLAAQFSPLLVVFLGLVCKEPILNIFGADTKAVS